MMRVHNFALACIFAGAALVLLAAPSPANAAASPGDLTNAEMRILSTADVHLYREIFAEERSGKFAEARAHERKLSDTSLKGYILAEHYLSNHSGRTPLRKLNDWLDEYGDLSMAPRIAKLANRRARPLRADVNDIPSFRRRGGGYEDVDLPDQPLITPAASAAYAQIRTFVRSDQPDQAASVLNQLQQSGQAQMSDIARIAQYVAASYLAEGMNKQAYAMATNVQGASAAPLLDWWAGQAAYRMMDYKDAAPHFEKVAQVGSLPSWTRAAGAFWAARSYMRSGDPLKVVTLLTAAARERPTFYGMLAERMLGMDPQKDFENPTLEPGAFASLMREPAAHRAVALWQVGRRDDVPNEMARAFANLKYADTPAFVATARHMDLPNLELRASETAASRGKLLTGLFPVPHYAPEGGYKVDPSLILAFVRIESRFMPDVTSPAGAHGLMQLMPGTARAMAGGDPGDLSDPSHSLTLGQRYIMRLLDQVNGNLFQLAAAYNAGPGSLNRWLARRGVQNDPLLFIESMPSPETRMYVKRVMTYHWMYRRRLNQDAPTLDQTAEGAWPRYTPQTTPIANLPKAVKTFDAQAWN